LEEIMDEEGELNAEAAASLADAAAAAAVANGAGDAEKQAHDTTGSQADQASKTATKPEEVGQQEQNGAVVTLDGERVEDEFESDAMNYQILLGKIDVMLERLKLDA
jgi:hypothetical protein